MENVLGFDETFEIWTAPATCDHPETMNHGYGIWSRIVLESECHFKPMKGTKG
jgi:hypothetical protein